MVVKFEIGIESKNIEDKNLLKMMLERAIRKSNMSFNWFKNVDIKEIKNVK